MSKLTWLEWLVFAFAECNPQRYGIQVWGNPDAMGIREQLLAMHWDLAPRPTGAGDRVDLHEQLLDKHAALTEAAERAEQAGARRAIMDHYAASHHATGSPRALPFTAATPRAARPARRAIHEHPHAPGKSGGRREDVNHETAGH